MSTTRSFGLVLLLLPGLLSACGRVDGEEKAKFPTDWIGVFEGDLHISGANGKTQTVKTRLTVAATDAPDRWRWELQYGEQPARKYELVAVDAAKGEFQIDEKNSIVLPARFVEDELISLFSVSGNRLTIRYRKVGEGVVFDVLSSTAEATVVTGGKDRVPKVFGFGLQSRQRGLLKPVKAK